MSNLGLKPKAEDERESMPHYAVGHVAPKGRQVAPDDDDEMSNLALNVRSKPSAMKKKLPLPQPDLE
eukprot:3457325-Prymnesium_polylepis.1